VTWGITILSPALLAVLLHWLLDWTLGWWVAVLWNVALLYVTLGFRQFSHHFTGIREALENGDEDKARELLAQWQQVQVGQIPRSEIVRHVIEYSVIAAHRHVFGVFFWYAALSIIGLGPVGAVIYRLTEFTQRRWQVPSADGSFPSEVLRSVSTRAWQAVDWLPSHMTALGFAIVGSFGGGYYKGSSDEEARQQIEIAAANAKARETEQNMVEVAQTYATTLRKANDVAKAKETKLRADVATGTLRLSIPTQSPVCPASTSTPAAGDSGEARTELDRTTAEALISIAADGDAAIRKLNTCIQSYETLRNMK
jgi:cobalamin biosynthesis protein CobD/CbiB